MNETTQYFKVVNSPEFIRRVSAIPNKIAAENICDKTK